MATKRRPLARRPLHAGRSAGKPVRPLAGRPVMITGAASGIGRSLARRLSGLGSPVAIADIDEAGLKETARTLPGPVLVRVLDVRDAADQRRFAAEVLEWLPSLADTGAHAGRGVQQRGRRGRLVGARRRPGRRRVAAADQLRRGGPRHPRLPAHPGRAGRRGDRQHLERVRPAGHALPERLLRVQVRGARLHRRAAPGTARHRRPRGDRPPGRRPDQHRPQRAGQEGPGGPRAQPRADGGRVRGAAADHAGQGGRDHLPRGRPRQGPHPGRPRRLRLRRPGPGHPHPLLRRDGAAREAAQERAR